MIVGAFMFSSACGMSNADLENEGLVNLQNLDEKSDKETSQGLAMDNADDDKNEDTAEGNLYDFAGIYTPCSYTDEGTNVSDITLTEDGIATGRVDTNFDYSKVWAGTKPVSITENEDGSITCEILMG